MLYVDQALVASLTEVDLLRVTGFITTFLKLYQNWSASGFQISYSYIPHKLLKCTVYFFFGASHELQSPEAVSLL